jgi:hypothetical protein
MSKAKLLVGNFNLLQSFDLLCVSVYVVLGFELRALCLLGRHMGQRS